MPSNHTISPDNTTNHTVPSNHTISPDNTTNHTIPHNNAAPSPSSNTEPLAPILEPSSSGLTIPDNGIVIPDSIYLSILIITIFAFVVFLKKTVWNKKTPMVYSALDEDNEDNEGIEMT